MLENAFVRILDMSKTAAIVIGVVVVVRLLLKKAPKWISYALWGVVLLRLLCPFSIEAPVSAVPRMETVSVELVDSTLPRFEFETPADRQINQHVLDTTPPGEPYALVTRSFEPTQWLSFIWLAGIAVMLICSVVSYIKLRRRLVGAMPLRDNIYLADRIVSPFVMGIICPKIYLPSNIGESEREYIILHEQRHIRRLDHVIKVLAFAALCLHWFNPLVWLAFILAGKDMEMSCDEAVIKNLGSEIRADYSASLLSLATGRRIIAGTPLAFGEGDTKGRIKNIANWKKPVIWVVIIAVLVCAVLAVCLLTDPVDKGDTIELTERNSGNEITAQFALNLGSEVNSGDITAELWQNGECVKSAPAIFTKFAEEISLCITPVKGEEKYEYVDVQISTNQYGGSVLTRFNLPKYSSGGLGWATMGRKINEKTKLQPETDKILLAVAFDMGSGVHALDCESLENEPERLEKYECILVIRANFSAEDLAPQQSGEVMGIGPIEVLQLHHVIKLAEKGYELGWEDFEDFYFIETRQGLYIREYEIDETFTLSIEGKSPNGGTEPIHIYLCANGLDDRIDIRDGGVEEFIAEHSGKTDDTLTLDDSCLGSMRSIRAKWITLISGGNNEDKEQWAKVMNAAADNVVERSESIKYFWNVDVYSDTEETFRFYAGPEENIVMMYYHWDKDAYGTYFFEDKALYDLIRGSFTYEGIVDEDSLAEYEGIIAARAEGIIREYNRIDEGRFTGYELTEFCKYDSFQHRNNIDFDIYRCNIAFIPEDPNEIVWAGGMWLDSELRVRDYDLYTYLVVRAVDGEMVDYNFMFYDTYTEAGTDEERSSAHNEILNAWGEE